MAVSKEEREAYERGQKERETQSSVFYLIKPSEHKGDTKVEKAVFQKGLCDE